MPVRIDFSLVRGEDAVLSMAMTPAEPVGGWTMQFQVGKRFGWSSGLITKSCASGFNGVSGMAVTNSGNGNVRITINRADTSGLEQANYAYQLARLDSGYATVTTEGLISML